MMADGWVDSSDLRLRRCMEGESPAGPPPIRACQRYRPQMAGILALNSVRLPVAFGNRNKKGHSRLFVSRL